MITPRDRLVITFSTDENIKSARQALFTHRIEKLPLVDAHDRIVGLITAKDIIKLQEHPDATKDAKGQLRVGVAVGVRSEDRDRAMACAEAGCDVLVLDVAHGHADHTLDMVRDLKAALPGIPVIAGNVATAAGVQDLAAAGADAVKVGVGSGSICITREVTGFGVPQLSAVAECAEAGHRLDVPIIADGGPAATGRYHQSPGRWGKHGDARQPARRHCGKSRRRRRARRPAVQDRPPDGLPNRQRRPPPDRQQRTR